MAPVEWEVDVPDSMSSTPPWSTASPGDMSAASDLAVQMLWTMTGRVLGTRTVLARPCFGPPDDRTTYAGRSFASGPGFWPGLVLGNPLATGPCGCTSPVCNAGGLNSCSLPGPVQSIVSVQIDTDTLDPDDYYVRDRRWLIRRGGRSWPQAQNLDAAPGTVGAFAVTYVQGIPVQQAGRTAAGILAVEILRGLVEGACALPPNVTSLVREGVNIEFDPAAFLESGQTGIIEVDQWVRSMNPSAVRNPGRVIIPGERGQYRR